MVGTKRRMLSWAKSNEAGAIGGPSTRTNPRVANVLGRMLHLHTVNHLRARKVSYAVELSSSYTEVDLSPTPKAISPGPGPSIAHLESQYSWAQIRLAAYILGSRPSAQVPEDSRTRNGC